MNSFTFLVELVCLHEASKTVVRWTGCKRLNTDITRDAIPAQLSWLDNDVLNVRQPLDIASSRF